ncbi:MAG: hypothetical protein ABI810_05945 [Sphingomonas bacterium]
MDGMFRDTSMRTNVANADCLHRPAIPDPDIESQPDFIIRAADVSGRLHERTLLDKRLNT